METVLEKIVDLHCELEKVNTKYSKVQNENEAYLHFITQLIEKKNFEEVLKESESYLNCLYYSLNFFYKVKKLGIDCNFFDGKFYKRDEPEKNLYHEEHVLPCLKHFHQGTTIGYSICDDSMTHSIPIFLRESECFVGKDDINLTITNDVLYQQNYRKYAKANSKALRSLGLYYLIDLSKLIKLIIDDLKEKNDKSQDKNYNEKFIECSKLIKDGKIKF
jgi:hypothetical protein